jgi:multisubunit Na+/H+ antiporter MnhF subunit
MASLVLMVCWQKDIFIKILCLNSLTSLVALFIFVLGSILSNESYFDIAIIYFFLGFLTSSAFLRYFMQYNVSNKL